MIVDLHRFPRWNVEIADVQDIETSRSPIWLEVVPINLSSPPVASTRMDLEPRVRLENVTVVPKAIRGSPPQWIREETQRRSTATVRGMDRDTNRPRHLEDEELNVDQQ